MGKLRHREERWMNAETPKGGPGGDFGAYVDKQDVVLTVVLK